MNSVKVSFILPVLVGLDFPVSCLSRSWQPDFEMLLHTVQVGLEAHEVDVVAEAVEHRSGDSLVRHGFGQLSERLVRGESDRSGFVAYVDKLEQHVRLLGEGEGALSLPRRGERCPRRLRLL